MSYVMVAAFAMSLAKALWILIQDIRKILSTPKAAAAEFDSYWDRK